jgi:hypothetical protein
MIVHTSSHIPGMTLVLKQTEECEFNIVHTMYVLIYNDSTDNQLIHK